MAACLNNLAVLLKITGRYGEAEELHARCIAIKERAMGPTHPQVPQVPSTPHACLPLQRPAGIAFVTVNRACCSESGIETAGIDAQVALSLANLAALLQVQGKYAQAEELLHRALMIREDALGPDHPLVRLLTRDRFRAVQDCLRGLGDCEPEVSKSKMAEQGIQTKELMRIIGIATLDMAHSFNIDYLLVVDLMDAH
jgi:tetratricopeptide (TPR) repeat protein